MRFVKISYKRFLFLWLFLSRTLNRSALAHRRDAGQTVDQQSTIIFVASVRDFQLTGDSQFVPDKFELWRQEIKSLGLSAKLVVMPFSEKQNKSIPQEAYFIEPFALPSRFTGIGVGAIFSLLRSLHKSQQTLRTPQSIYITRQLWKNFLLYSKPKVVIGIGLTDLMLEVCSELGIKTIECQHGVFSAAELKRWWRTPSEVTDYFPDLFVTWDRHYSEIATKLGINALTLGYPFDFSKIDHDEAILQQPTRSAEASIVATLSCRETSGIDPWGMIDTNMDFAISVLLGSGFRVQLRVHPMAEKGFIRRFKVSRWLSQRYPGCEVIFPSDETILQSLKAADIHLTVSSSTMLEAAYLGIPTLCFSTECLSWFPDQIMNMGIVKPTNRESILEDVIELIKFPTNKFRNPLDIQRFRQVVLEWTANSNE